MYIAAKDLKKYKKRKIKGKWKTELSPSKISVKFKKKRGRKPKNATTKPNLKLALDICGYQNTYKALGITQERLSNWLYKNVDVPRKYSRMISELSLGIVKSKHINLSYSTKDYSL
jgi:hypothetical protein